MRDNKEVGEWEVQTIGCKIGSGMYCTIGNIAIFSNNCKWKVTFKNCIKNFKIFLNKNCLQKKNSYQFIIIIATTGGTFKMAEE